MIAYLLLMSVYLQLLLVNRMYACQALRPLLVKLVYHRDYPTIS